MYRRSFNIRVTVTKPTTTGLDTTPEEFAKRVHEDLQEAYGQPSSVDVVVEPIPGHDEAVIEVES